MPALSKLLVVAWLAAASAFSATPDAAALENQMVSVQSILDVSEVKKAESFAGGRNFDILGKLMAGNRHEAVQSLKDLVVAKQSVLGRTVCNNEVHKMFKTTCKDADETSPGWFTEFCQEMKDWRRAHPDDPCGLFHDHGHAAPPAPPGGGGGGGGGGEVEVEGWEQCLGSCIYPDGGHYRRCAFSSDEGGPGNEDECLMLAASVKSVIAAEMEVVNTTHVCHVFVPWDTLCYEVGLERKAARTAGCSDCLEYRYSPVGPTCELPDAAPSTSLVEEDDDVGTEWVCA